ncbi:MAG: hypothetical protein IPI92_20095 [Gemmatimonadetes bacterium]|nr:hypothetical protein [Gemmatimonadota bacterium]
MMDEFDINAEPDLALLEGTEDEDQELVQESADDDSEQDGDNGEQGEKEEVEPEEEKPSAKRDPVIPRARFDEIHSQWKAEQERAARLEAELHALRQQKQEEKPTDAVDLRELKQRLFDSRLDPDSDQDEIDKIEDQIEAERDRRAEARAEARITERERIREAEAAQMAARQQEAEAQTEASKLVKKYPWLDSVSGNGDPEAIAEVIALRDGYFRNGQSLSAALVKAAGVIARARGEASQPINTIDERRSLALVEAAKSAAAQPARGDAGVGNRAMPADKSILDNQDAYEKADVKERMRLLA